MPEQSFIRSKKDHHHTTEKTTSALPAQLDSHTSEHPHDRLPLPIPDSSGPSRAEDRILDFGECREDDRDDSGCVGGDDGVLGEANEDLARSETATLTQGTEIESGRTLGSRIREARWTKTSADGNKDDCMGVLDRRSVN